MAPYTVLSFPTVFDQRDRKPEAVLLLPVVLKNKEDDPIEVLEEPVVFLFMAFAPVAVLFDGSMLMKNGTGKKILWTSLRKFITQSNDYLEEIAEEIDARIKRELEEN